MYAPPLALLEFARHDEAPKAVVAVLILFYALFCVFMFFATIFWIWMLVEAATKESDQGNTRVTWVLVVALTSWVGALIYFFARRGERKRTLGR
jgi:hypothetical protein